MHELRFLALLRRVRWMVLPLIVFVLSSCTRAQHSVNISQLDMEPLREFSAEEIDAGVRIHSQILSDFYTYTEPKAAAYIQQIGASLIEGAASNPAAYRFTILHNDRIYATSAPGGFIYVTTGLINFLENEAELAGVLAHEIGAMQYRDPNLSGTQRAFDQFTQATALVGPAFGQIGALAAMGVILANAASKSNGLSQEEQLVRADRRALKYMVRAGYDPQGLIDLFYRFIHADKKIMPYFYDYYQSHPITEERFMQLNQAFQELPLHGKSFTVRRERFAEMTKGIREIYRV